MIKKQTIRLNESQLRRIVKESVKKMLKERLNREKGISILKQASEAYIQWKKTEDDLNDFYKKSGIEPDCSGLYRCRDHFFDIMQMNRGDVLHPYIHPFIDSLAEIMYDNGLNVDDVVSLNLPPFNMVSAEKIENAFDKRKDEMEYAEHLQHYEDIRNERQAIWDDNSAYTSKTTGIPEDEL